MDILQLLVFLLYNSSFLVYNDSSVNFRNSDVGPIFGISCSPAVDALLNMVNEGRTVDYMHHGVRVDMLDEGRALRFEDKTGA